MMIAMYMSEGLEVFMYPLSWHICKQIKAKELRSNRAKELRSTILMISN